MRCASLAADGDHGACHFASRRLRGICLNLRKTSAEISSGVYWVSPTLTKRPTLFPDQFITNIEFFGEMSSAQADKRLTE
jgi:hypothetical protein